MSINNVRQYPSFTKNDLEISDKTTVFQGFFRLERYTLRHKLFKGGWSKPIVREIFERGNAVVILPYNPITDELVLIEQMRVGAIATSPTPWLLEVIAGMNDKNESAENVAKREALEEAGLTIEDCWPMLSYLSSPGGTTERIEVFLGRLTGPVAGGVFGLDEENEDIKVHVMARQDAMLLLEQGVIDNAATVIALQWLALNIDKVKQAWRN